VASDASADFVVDYPTLGFLATDWVEAHCVIPDGFRIGDPFVYSGWQAYNVFNFYRVKPDAVGVPGGQLGTAFHYRRSQTVRPQKTGKGPFIASVICLEAVGPALFAAGRRRRGLRLPRLRTAAAASSTSTSPASRWACRGRRRSSRSRRPRRSRPTTSTPRSGR
jgi:hypothetical protein